MLTQLSSKQRPVSLQNSPWVPLVRLVAFCAVVRTISAIAMVAMAK